MCLLRSVLVFCSIRARVGLSRLLASAAGAVRSAETCSLLELAEQEIPYNGCTFMLLALMSM